MYQTDASEEVVFIEFFLIFDVFIFDELRQTSTLWDHVLNELDCIDIAGIIGIVVDLLVDVFEVSLGLYHKLWPLSLHVGCFDTFQNTHSLDLVINYIRKVKQRDDLWEYHWDWSDDTG